MRIYSVGTIFVMISLGMNLFLMSQGFSGMSMLTTLIGAVPVSYTHLSDPGERQRNRISDAGR